ncbi:MAG TPA: TetR family transcriptional regulator [Solirubrobacteraceae bacterium]|nr:TetR family transcriptional regulator [Solirubrobacteraceae bacterium]
MALTRSQIIDAGCALLAEDGLAGLTMRRLAQRLEVAPGALYYHVPSKQDLLAAIAEQILDTAGISTDDPARAAHDIRAALLRVRDSAEVISFVNAFRPEVLGPFRTLERTFGLPPQQARWAARTLIHYVLGFVAEEQNQAELARVRIVADFPAGETSAQAFRFGVTTILRGLPEPSR